MSTRIEWTDETWNPLVGCSRISEGCDHCYAIATVHRGLAPQHRGLTVQQERTDWTGEIREVWHRLEEPLRWREPRRVFVNSLSDLFHPDVDSEYVAEVFAVMTLAPQHTFQVLTKRPQLMRRMLTNDAWLDVADEKRLARAALSFDLVGWPKPNIWLGTSIETARYAWRADHLRETPAAVRFLSLEPLLAPVHDDLDLTGIGWVIVGGESGRGARPMETWWAEALIELCRAHGVPVFVKQLGSVAAKRRGLDGKGDQLHDLPTALRVREWPA